MAKLLGFESYSHYKLDTEMAASPKNVEKLLKKVWGPAREVAIRDEAHLTSMMRDDEVNDTLKGWDWRFYAERRRLKEYDLDGNLIKDSIWGERNSDGTFKYDNLPELKSIVKSLFI